MTKNSRMAVNGLVLVFAFGPVGAQSTDAGGDARPTTQKERQLEKTERNQAIKDATRKFRDFVRDLRIEYRDRITDLEAEFEQRRVELRAEYDAKIAEAEAERQKKFAELLTGPDARLDEATIAELRLQAQRFSDELFELRKEAAEALHQARVAKEMRQNEILTEQDRLALEKASSLGLTQAYSPILATPAGQALTAQEERWNERERQEVLRLEDRNAQLLNEYATGEALRTWEIENLKEDFKLEWDEKTELHALDSEQYFYEALVAYAVQAGSFDQKKLASKITELSKQRKLIQIRFNEIRDRNRIKRREEKTEILAY